MARISNANGGPKKAAEIFRISLLEDPILSAEPRQLLALGGGEARLPLRAIGAGAMHPLAQRRLGLTCRDVVR